MAVAAATGLSDRTIRTGMAELDDPDALPSSRQRKPGAGRRRREAEQPELAGALQALIEATTRGDPMSPLRWTCKSTRTLAKQLNRQGFVVSSSKIGQLLRSEGYSLQSNLKTVEGKQHPDRDAQFQHVARRVRAFQRTGQPAISVDTKKKEPLGNMKNPGKTYRPKGHPTSVSTHDFPDRDLGKAVPYGVYDLARNEAGVSIGISHDTAEFAAAAIERWWKAGETLPENSEAVVCRSSRRRCAPGRGLRPPRPPPPGRRRMCRQNRRSRRADPGPRPGRRRALARPGSGQCHLPSD